jgi:hypothetical protein
MKDQYNWNAQKKDLWKMPPNKLMEVLQELEKEKFHLENALHLEGKSVHRYGYGTFSGSFALSATKKWGGGNMKKLRKMIACVKTMLNVKLSKKG